MSCEILTSYNFTNNMWCIKTHASTYFTINRNLFEKVVPK